MAGPFDQYLEQSAAPPSGGAFDQYLSGKSGAAAVKPDYSTMAKDAGIGVLAGPGGMMDVVEKYGPQFGPWGERAAALSGNFRDLGFTDELKGFQSGVLSLAKGGDYISAYRDSVDKARQRLEEARAKHPLTSFAGQLAGGAALAGATGGASLAVASKVPVLSGLTRAAASPMMAWFDARPALANAFLGGIGGGISGAAYGFGAGDSDIVGRLESAKETAKWGAGFGLVSPLALGGLKADTAFLRAPAGAAIGATGALVTGHDPAEWAGYGALAGAAGKPIAQAVPKAAKWLYDRRPEYIEPVYQTNSLLGGLGNYRPRQPPSAGQPPEPVVPEEVIRETERNLARQRKGVDEWERAVADAEARPLGRTMADVGGQQFLAKADMLAQSPGESGPIAASIAERRAGAFARQITDDLREKLGVNMTPGESLDALTKAAGTASDGYEQVLAQKPNAEVVATKLAPLMKADRRFQDAMRRRYEIEETQSRIAEMDNSPPPPRSVAAGNDGKFELLPTATGRALHSLKTNLDDAFVADARMRDLSSSGKGEKIEILDPLRKRFLGLMDQALPGYDKVRLERGGIFEATKALEDGAKLLSKTPEEIDRIMKVAGQFERKQLQIGAADDIRTRVMKSGTDEDSGRMRNAANPIINPEMKARIKALFDDPQKADEFISNLNERDRLFRNSARWIGGADTYRRAAQAADSGLAQMADMGAKAFTNPTGAAGDLGRLGWNALLGRHFEARNNKIGNAFLSEIDSGTPEQRAYNAELIRELRKRQIERIRRATTAAGEGVQGAVGGGVLRDQYDGGY